ncbi:hypothetical protein LEP1GSC127_1056 [Leptospira kirschneri str. 200801925]|nr:hypothetical protein LEP1GSC127_1056 [Leptospira kirschneri str. 200801925]
MYSHILKSKRFILILLCCAILIFVGVKIFISEKNGLLKNPDLKELLFTGQRTVILLLIFQKKEISIQN